MTKGPLAEEFKAALMEKCPRGGDGSLWPQESSPGRETLAELVIVVAGIGHQPPLAWTVWTFNEDFTLIFSDVNRDNVRM